MITQHITPNLWFANEAEDAAKFYTGIFPNSRITNVSRYGEAGQEVHHQPEGQAMVVAFELNGQPFLGLNGGPIFKFNEAVSFVINCESQDDIDYYWDKLTAGGDPNAQQCGWLKDRFGLSWQIVPKNMAQLLGDQSTAGGAKAMQEMLKMKKIDIATLQRAHEPA